MAGGVGDAALRRDLLDGVLDAVRALGTLTDPDEIMQRIVDDAVGSLGFHAAAINIRRADGRLYVSAVAGPDDVRAMLGASAAAADWQGTLDLCTRTGGLFFLHHDAADEPAVRAMVEWVQENAPDLPEDAWHAHDTLIAPMYDADGVLAATLSVDLAVGSLHDHQQRMALELFVAQAQRALRDSAARQRSEQRRRDAEGRAQLAWESGLVAAALIDADGRVIGVNDAALRALGYDRDELLGQHLLVVVPTENTNAALDRFDLLFTASTVHVSERTLKRRDGSLMWCDMHSTTVVEGDPPRSTVLVQWTDITDRKLAEQRMEHELRHDPLTDLPNRHALDGELARLQAEQIPFGLLYCDIDGFKSISDAIGNEGADGLLVLVARRLAAKVPAGAMLARLAGDEFVVCVEGTADVGDVVQVASAVLEDLGDPFEVGTDQHLVRMSIGVSTLRPWHRRPVEVLREADQALLRAKRRGRSRIEVFDPARDHSSSPADFDFEQALRTAADGGAGLEPFFQSIISLTSGATVGYEALMRWRLSGHGVLQPDRFLPVAERIGLSAALGWRMFELVGAAMPRPPLSKLDRPWIAINVSAAQLGRGALLDALKHLLDSAFSDDAGRLHLEITETSLLDATPRTIDELYAVVDLGVRIALDDFGTGYSSLTLLRDLPVTAVKIDRSFIAPIAVDIRARTIVQHTIELCQGLGMTTVAEGIETHEQLAWLQTLGCDFGQGYLIDRPSPWPFDDRGRVQETPRRFGS